MYLFPVEIRESKIDGQGVFTLERISKGQTVWKFDRDHDKAVSLQEFETLDDVARDDLKRVGYLSPTTNRYVYPPEHDAARFTNHSPHNNLSAVTDLSISEEPYFVANRDIEFGEELTNNYIEFDESVLHHTPHWIKT